MRAFVVLLFSIGCALALPQGYNYQIEVGPSGGSSVQAIPNEYQQLIQQISPQIAVQQQPQIVLQEQFAGQIPQISQGFSVDQSGPQYANSLLQNAQEVIQYQQQQQQQQQTQTSGGKTQVRAPATEVEAPQENNAHNGGAHNSFGAADDSQPQFIIKSRQQQNGGNSFDSSSPAAENKVTFQKEFYYLSAPQDDYETPSGLDQQLATIKKNLRIVFIRAPESNGLENAALQLAKQAAQQQTAIYVLTKQHDASELAQKLNSVHTTPQQPEVAFIKYRTPAEAEHAQRVIQAQYEALEGVNHINRPDVGVSHNFVGSTAGLDPRTSHTGTGEKIGIGKPPSTYLPSALKL
uniref:DUF243 domain-containing protein n=1 Tax=Stomoxys calcitrans TaxID=35570 RepID=A0A1I8PL51_STOCA